MLGSCARASYNAAAAAAHLLVVLLLLLLLCSPAAAIHFPISSGCNHARGVPSTVGTRNQETVSYFV
jgi:hypothetical protein